MDCSDIQDVLTHLDVSLAGKSVVDVGCGTGRMAQLCDGEYQGFDVAPGMVEYATGHGVNASLIDSPADLTGVTAGIYLCLSVFTHVPRELRQKFLTVFAANTSELLADILDGGEGGSIGAWYADETGFEADLSAAGFVEWRSYKRGSPDGAGHRYYHAYQT